MQYKGMILEKRDAWDAPGGSKVKVIQPGNYLFSAPVNGYASLTYDGRLVWTKVAWISNYLPLATPPPVEPPPADDEYFLHVKDGVTRKFILDE